MFPCCKFVSLVTVSSLFCSSYKLGAYICITEHKTVAAVLCTSFESQKLAIISNNKANYCIQMSKFTKQIDAGKLDSKFQEIEGSDHGV